MYINNNDNSNSSDTNHKEELDFNKRNREDFENLMADSSTNLDGYWDKNNPFVKLLLLVLAVIIILGAFYYISTYLGSH